MFTVTLVASTRRRLPDASMTRRCAFPLALRLGQTLPCRIGAPALMASWSRVLLLAMLSWWRFPCVLVSNICRSWRFRFCSVSFFSSLRWVRTFSVPLGDWSLEDAAAFGAVFSCDIDRAWAIGHRVAGGGTSYTTKAPTGVCWSLGLDGTTRRGFWETFRRQRHDGRHAAAAAIADTIGKITRDALAERLAIWKRAVNVRKGAAVWFKRRIAVSRPFSVPPFNAAMSAASENANRLGGRTGELMAHWIEALGASFQSLCPDL